MKKIFSFLLTAVVSFSCMAYSTVQAENAKSVNTLNQTQSNREGPMRETQKQFDSIINNLSLLPINFVYDGVYYSGFSPFKFKQLSKTVSDENGVLKVDILLEKSQTLQILINTVLYKNYDAWEYTVHFKNPC